MVSQFISLNFSHISSTSSLPAIQITGLPRKEWITMTIHVRSCLEMTASKFFSSGRIHLSDFPILACLIKFTQIFPANEISCQETTNGHYPHPKIASWSLCLICLITTTFSKSKVFSLHLLLSGVGYSAYSLPLLAV